MGLGRMKIGTACSRDIELGPVWHMVAAQEALLQVYNQKKTKKNTSSKIYKHPSVGKFTAVIFTIAKR